MVVLGVVAVSDERGTPAGQGLGLGFQTEALGVLGLGSLGEGPRPRGARGITQRWYGFAVWGFRFMV